MLLADCARLRYIPGSISAFEMYTPGASTSGEGEIMLASGGLLTSIGLPRFKRECDDAEAKLPKLRSVDSMGTRRGFEGERLRLLRFG